MAEAATKLPVKTDEKVPAPTSALQTCHPFETLHHEIDRLFEDFDRHFWRKPFGRSMFDIQPLMRRGLASVAMPAVDIVKKDNTYEAIAELPGLDERSIEVKLVNGSLTIKGEKEDEKEEKKKDYYLHERHFGAFERSFPIPDGVDVDKIDATFKKGVLTLTLPKKPEAQKPAKKIEVKAA